MRQAIVLVALLSVAYATDQDNLVRDTKGAIQCVVETTQKSIDNSVSETIDFFKSIGAKDSAKKTIEKLHKQRLDLQDKLNASASNALKLREKCIEEAGGSLFLGTRCTLRAGTKFAFSAGISVANFGVDVATILTDDNVDFTGANLRKALQLTKKQVHEIADSIRASIKCFQDRFQMTGYPELQ